MREWFWPTDARGAGGMNLWGSLVAAAVAAVSGAIVQLEMWTPESDVISPQTASALITAHVRLFTLVTAAAVPLAVGYLALPVTGRERGPAPAVSAVCALGWWLALVLVGVCALGEALAGAPDEGTPWVAGAFSFAWLVLAVGCGDVLVAWLRPAGMKTVVGWAVIFGALIAVALAALRIIALVPMVVSEAEAVPAGGVVHRVDAWVMVAGGLPALILALDALIRRDARVTGRVLAAGVVLTLGAGAAALAITRWGGPDVHLHDTTLEVASAHGLLGATWLALFAAVWRRPRTSPLGVAGSIGLLIAPPAHVAVEAALGLRGMPSRYYGYVERFQAEHQLATVAASIVLVGSAAIVVDLARSPPTRPPPPPAG